MLETAGLVGFAAIALAAMSLSYELGGYLLAAGWFGHAAWDFAHYRAAVPRGKPVARVGSRP